MTLTTLQLSEPYGQICYREEGQGSLIVMLHGVGMQSAAWAPQLAHLSQNHRVICIDLPGHGGSSALASDAELEDFVAWLHAAFLALKVGPVALVGHSMGALIAGGYAATHPAMVSRVALLNCVYQRTNEARAAVVARAEEIREGRFDLETPLDRWFGDTPTEVSAREQVSSWLKEVDVDGYATAYSAFSKGDMRYAQELGNIACPLLALTGDGDLNSSAEMSQAIADKVQHGQSVVIAGHRHMVSLTAPEPVNAALDTWLAMPVEGGSDD